MLVNKGLTSISNVAHDIEFMRVDPARTYGYLRHLPPLIWQFVMNAATDAQSQTIASYTRWAGERGYCGRRRYREKGIIRAGSDLQCSALQIATRCRRS